MSTTVMRRGPADTSTGQWDRLSAFSLLWGLAIMVHASAYPFNMVSTPISPVMVAVAFALVLRPRSVTILLALAVVQVIEFLVRAPVAPNHWYLATFMNLVIVGAISQSLFQQRHIERDATYDRLAVGGRLLVVILFFTAAFHKLNYDYLDAEVSCAVQIYGRVAEWYHLPRGRFMSLLAVYGTFVVEILIPVLLLIPGARRWGILGGLMFHMFLGMRDVYDFAAILYALYFLFTPRDFLPTLLARHAGLIGTAGRSRWVRFLLPLLLLIPMRWLFGVRWTGEVFAPLWTAAAILAIYLFVTTASAVHTHGGRWSELFRPMSVSALFVACLCLLSSLSPYVGLKSDAAFEMYSNLQVENGKSNHLLIPASWQVFGFTRDVAEIVTSDDPRLEAHRRRGLLMTRHELMRRITQEPQYTSTVRYRGSTYVLPAQRDEIGSVHPLASKLLTFDAIEQTDWIGCTW